MNNFIDAERQKHFRNYRCRLQLYSFYCVHKLYYTVESTTAIIVRHYAQLNMHLMNFLVRDQNLSTFDRMFAVTAASVIASSVFCRTTQRTDITTLNSIKLSDSVGKILVVGALILVLGVITMRHHKSITLLS